MTQVQDAIGANIAMPEIPHHTELFSEEFLSQYRGRQPKWGFGELGYVVYKRTYARTKDDGTTEEWWETVERCVRGAQKIGAQYTRQEAERLYDHIFNLRCSFSGRGLWQLGTKTVDLIGADSLLNCWVTKASEPSDFAFIFIESMLGGGVGPVVAKEFTQELPRVKTGVKVVRKDTADADFIIPDSKEGWMALWVRIIEAYLVTGKSFSYSPICIRTSGSPIKTFGGVAPGPKPLMDGAAELCRILESREGKKLRTQDVSDIICCGGQVVKSGGVRRTALILQGDVDDMAFINLKRWDKDGIPAYRANSNNSILCSDFEHLSDRFWQGYNGNGEPCGLINLVNCRRYGRLDETAIEEFSLKDDGIIGVNPCLTGDTKIYVADGRGITTIRDLAQRGKDVPVFCLDDRGGLTVRTMRHPRVTGHKKRIVKVTLDDGSTLRCTENHKLRLKDGKYVEVKNLRAGDSLHVLTRFEASIKDVFPNANSRSQDYFWINNGRATNVAEHRPIWEFSNNSLIPKGWVIHHKDFDAQNNDPKNLEGMAKVDHDRLHGDRMCGDNNPMRRALSEWPREKWDRYHEIQSKNNSGEGNPRYSGFTHEQIREHAMALTKLIGRRFSTKEWAAYATARGLPAYFSGWREHHLNGVMGLSKWAAEQCGYSEHTNEDPRLLRRYREALDAGYDTAIVEGEVLVEKACEHCQVAFRTEYSRREVAYCSRRCSNLKTWSNAKQRNSRLAGRRLWVESHRAELRSEQLRIFTDVAFKLGRKPLKKEWEAECKMRGVSAEVSRKSSPFTSWAALKEGAACYNHRVVSVEIDGEEDVYNGTVDEYHNFFVGGWEAATANGKRKWVFVNNRQCGEATLHDKECCNLAELFLNRLESKEQMLDCAVLLYKTQKAIAAMKYLHDETTKVVHKNMRLGLGVTGICQRLDVFEEWCDYTYCELRKFDKKYSAENGWPQSIRLTVVKPSGTLSLLAGATPGGHPGYEEYHIRTVRFSSGDPLVSKLRRAGYRVEPEIQLDGKENHDIAVVYFPCHFEGGGLMASQCGAIRQMELLKKLQTVWSDQAVSITVYYTKEELPEIQRWLQENYNSSIKTISFLLFSGHGFAQAVLTPSSREEHEKLFYKIRPIDHQADSGGSIDSQECQGGVCPIK